MLKSVGILFSNAESAANHINKVWYNVEKWWFDATLQTVRKDYCRKYARRDKGFEKRLSQVLSEATVNTKQTNLIEETKRII